jgi:exosortase/archaeosortase family protein
MKSKKNKKKINKQKLVVNEKKGSLKNELNLGSKNTKISLFLIKFFAIFFILTTLVELLDLLFFTEWLAFISAMPFKVNVVSNLVFVNGENFLVTNSCTGLVSASILAAIIFSLKKPLIKQKILLFLFGMGILLVLNIPRLMLVLWSASVGLDAELVHIITWFFMSIFILIIWYFGTKRIAKINDFSELL